MSNAQKPQTQQVVAILTSIIHAQTRLFRAKRGLDAASKRFAQAAIPFMMEYGRPTLPLLRGAHKITEGMAEFLEGTVNFTDALADAFPAMTTALRASKDNHGAVPLEVMLTVGQHPEIASATAKLTEEIGRHKSAKVTEDDSEESEDDDDQELAMSVTGDSSSAQVEEAIRAAVNEAMGKKH